MPVSDLNLTQPKPWFSKYLGLRTTVSMFALAVGVLMLPDWTSTIFWPLIGVRAKSHELIIDELRRFVPSSAISSKYRAGAWWWRQDVAGARGGTLLVTGKWSDERPAQPGSFQTENEMFQKGFTPGVVETYVDNLVPPVSVNPGVRGWHRISFGVYSRAVPATFQGGFRFGVRLSGEPFPVFVQGSDDVADGFQEVFWKSADLTGKSLELSQVKAEMQRPGMGLMAGIDYIRLVPMSEEEAKVAIQLERSPPPVEHRLFGLLDYTDEVHLWGTFETADDIRAVVYRHKDAGFGRVYWRAYGTTSDHSLRLREAAPKWNEADEKAYLEYFKIKAGWMPYIKPTEKFDPLRVAVDYGQKTGVEIHAFVRMANYNRPPRANFWHEHPEFYLIDRDGKPKSRVLSYGYPEVRQFYLQVMKDIASTGVKGILLDWLRHPPAIGYEKPVSDAFRKKYGIEMNSLPETDQRISDHHAGYINMFMRDLRKALPNVEISARVRNLNEYGLDAKTWVREGLIDTLIQGNWGAGSANELLPVEQGVQAVVRGTPVKAYVIAETSNSGWSRPFKGWFSAENIVKYAKHYREKGVDRFGLYETTFFTWYPHRRQAIWEAGRIMAKGSHR